MLQGYFWLLPVLAAVACFAVGWKPAVRLVRTLTSIEHPPKSEPILRDLIIVALAHNLAMLLIVTAVVAKTIGK